MNQTDLIKCILNVQFHTVYFYNYCKTLSLPKLNCPATVENTTAMYAI